MPGTQDTIKNHSSDETVKSAPYLLEIRGRILVDTFVSSFEKFAFDIDFEK